MKILVIPDTQVKDGVPLKHLRALGNYIVEKKPDVIVHIGDHWDMESISTYAKPKEMEGRRILADIQSGHRGMKELMSPIIEYNANRRRNKKRRYRPRLEFCLGNHEERLKRYVDSNPNLEGVINYPQAFHLGKYGWNVNEFLKPVVIGGISFAHYFYNPMSGRPYGGTCETKLKNIKNSFVMGHQQGLSMATTTGNDGQRYWGIVAGRYYMHDEGYIGPQGNDHWRGVVMLHNVDNGDCDPCVVGLDYLLKNYA